MSSAGSHKSGQPARTFPKNPVRGQQGFRTRRPRKKDHESRDSINLHRQAVGDIADRRRSLGPDRGDRDQADDDDQCQHHNVFDCGGAIVGLQKLSDFKSKPANDEILWRKGVGLFCKRRSQNSLVNLVLCRQSVSPKPIHRAGRNPAQSGRRARINNGNEDVVIAAVSPQTAWGSGYDPCDGCGLQDASSRRTLPRDSAFNLGAVRLAPRCCGNSAGMPIGIDLVA